MSATDTAQSRSWLWTFGSGIGDFVVQASVYGLCAVGGLAASAIFGFERGSSKAGVVGVALAVLLLVVALVTAALIWAWRLSR